MSMTPTMPAGSTITATEAFDLLSDDRRRSLLELLPDDGSSMALRTAALHLVLEESSEVVPTVGPEAFRRMVTSLHHSHLPRLADLDVVEYDVEAGTVRRGGAAAELDAYQP